MTDDSHIQPVYHCWGWTYNPTVVELTVNNLPIQMELDMVVLLSLLNKQIYDKTPNLQL